MKKWLIVTSCFLVAVMIFCSSGNIMAAGWIDPDKDCTFTLSAEDKLGEHPDLTESGLTAELYKVADISSNADFTPTERFKDLDLSSLSNKEATDWDKLIEAAMKVVGENGETNPKGDYTIMVSPGEQKAEIPVEKGLYLVCVDPVKTVRHEFTFAPYMASVPSNEAFMEDTEGAEMPDADDWLYDVTVGVKPEENIRYGEIVIEKNLDGYDDELGNPMFIFQVDGWLDEDRDGNEDLVYSNVVSLKFAEEGTLSAKATGIPSGARVTVKEIYSGAGYTLTDGQDGRTLTLMPNEEGLVNGTVSFTNSFDGSVSKGGSIVNHYKVHGNGWEWSPAEDSRGLEASYEEE